VTKSIFEREQESFFHTYKRLSLDIDRGEGVFLFDKSGKRYIDFFGGLAVNALGYCHPRIIEAIERQIRRYNHLSNYFVQDPQVELAERILRHAPGFEHVFFSNSGTEATEGVMKLARKWGQPLGKTDLFGLSNAFHGRTLGALSIMDKQKYRDGYEPFLPNTGTLPFNDVEALRRAVNEKTLGVFVEFIQGEGGIFTVAPEYARELGSLRDRYGFLIVADEIQAGIGRTGKFFAFEHYGIVPDIILFAKAIGGGLPLGGFLGNRRLAETLTYGVHGTTFGGNPVACAAGIAVLDEIDEKGLMQHATEIGKHLKAGAVKLKSEFAGIIKEVRGEGCMLGIDLHIPGQPVVEELQRCGFLVNCTHETVLRLLPPLVIEKGHCDALLHELASILRTFATAEATSLVK
jgi:acetylornithine/N-succinyldiaminopimelate aminotransferase